MLILGCVFLWLTGCEETVQTDPGPRTALTDDKPPADTMVPKEQPKEPSTAAKEANAEPQPSKPGPHITFEKTTHDFGDVGPGTKNVCEFTFKNDGDSLLKIGKISKTCGCTAFSLAKKQYAPGESGTIKVEYSASRSAGKVTRRLYVPSNDQKKPRVALVVKAAVALKVRHQPKKLNLVLKEENAGCPKITLTSVDGQPFAVKSFTTPRNSITAAFDPETKAKKIVLEPKVDIEKLKKSTRGFIRISLTHPQCRTVTVPFKALPRFKLQPPAITIRNVEPEKLVERELWILNNYDEDFDVESASSQKSIVKVSSREKLDKRYKLKLEIMPPARNDKQAMFTDVLHVRIKGGEKLSVTCRGMYATKKQKPTS
jgi:hypothetical protein